MSIRRSSLICVAYLQVYERVTDNRSSDHNSILFSIPMLSPKPSSSAPPRHVWLYNQADFDRANEILSSIPWSEILPPCPDTSWTIFKELFLRTMHICIPSKVSFPSTLPPHPWLNNKALRLIKQRNSAFRSAKRSGSTSLLCLYRSLRNKVVSYLRKLKSCFFKSLTSNPKSFWPKIKKLRKSLSSIPSLSFNDVLASTPTSKANVLNSYFSSCFNSSSPPLSSPSSPPPISTPPSLLCSPDNVLDLILNSPTNIAPGPDGISALMLRNTAHSISLPLSLIFNSSISSCSFPSDWKNAFVVPIPKSSSHSSSPSNFRPISLLSIVSKLLERHIFNFLYDFCMSNNLLSNSQFGFRPGFSTESALISVVNSWFSSLDSHKSVCAVFFDLSKAFDSVPHQPLLNSLSSLNLPPHLLFWFHSYLCNRTQQVIVNGSFSSKSHVVSGVPQGSILGPLLFILYLNDLSYLPFSSSVNLTLYADDILLSHTISSPFCMFSVQSNINLITSWLSTHLLNVNTNKTKYMIITRKPSPFLSSLPPLFLNNNRLECVSSYKYLGVLLCSNLSWSPHIKSVCSKSRKVLGTIFRHFYQFSSPKTLLCLYRALVLPHLSYCSSVWSPPVSSGDSRSLEKVQFFALKLCSKNWSSNYSYLLKSTNLPTLSSRRTQAKLILTFKFLNDLHYFPPSIFSFVNPSSRLSRHFDPLNISVPFSRSSASFHSFVPSASRLWNSLPHSTKALSTLYYFKKRIKSTIT